MKTRSFLALLLSSIVLPLHAADPMAPIVPEEGKVVKVACVGDSITEGAGAEPGKSYPAQLQKLLGDKLEVKNYGLGGRTMLRKGDHPYWNEGAFKEAQEYKPDVVIIMLGTNDTKPHNWQHKDDFAKDYKDFVKTFQRLKPEPRVYICRPVPVPGEGNFGINEKALQEEMPVIEKISKSLKTGLIDMYAALDGKPELLPDRVHPNTAGAGEMAKAAAKALTGQAP
ncbi:MAG: sialate O-acetylesterase [Verrucomicrobiaceae bacterium]|nr:MAG: sialate O-acetylesterase [Verrucomicrobiaceae bacterium]